MQPGGREFQSLHSDPEASDEEGSLMSDAENGRVGNASVGQSPPAGKMPFQDLLDGPAQPRDWKGDISNFFTLMVMCVGIWLRSANGRDDPAASYILAFGPQSTFSL